MSSLSLDVLDSLASGVLALDAENRILFLNRALAARLGAEPQAWTGRPLAELAPLFQSHLSSQFDLQSRLPADLAESCSAELEWRTENAISWLREDCGPLRDAAGRLAGRLLVYHDISREKAIDRMKSEFIAVASHELRTPMTSIKGSIDLILSGMAGEITTDTQELLEIAQNGCNRLIRLINDILDLSKIEAGQLKLDLVRMDLTEAVERSIRGVRALAGQNEVSLRMVRDENLPQVEADKDRIEQVITNLLSNAIKFSPTNGEVRVEVGVCDGWVQCAVIDQGRGIPEADLHRVFGKFEQVADAKKQGTGLGLAICQALIHEHSGKLWVESKLEEGSRFIFRLPAAAPPAN
jgi:signal transduction histidine kinase